MCMCMCIGGQKREGEEGGGRMDNLMYVHVHNVQCTNTYMYVSAII